MSSPFNFGVLAGGGYFTNRTKEIEKLSANFLNGVNTMLISPRRWGKSSLVQVTADKLTKKNKGIKFCYLDLFNTRTENEFYISLAEQLIKATSSKTEERLQSVKTFFRSLIPAISISPDQQQEFSLSFSFSDLKQKPDEILELAENIASKKGIKIVVCVDEFQSINFFENSLAFQKKLRSHWQRHKHVSYCLYGSKQHMLMDIFGSNKMPFYRFGDLMFLEKIEAKHWIPFIVERFEKTGKKISEDVAALIAERMDNHSYHVQQLGQEVWNVCGKIAKSEHVDLAVNELIKKMTILYQREVDLLSNTQVNFLKALCSGVEAFSSKSALIEFNLGTSANVGKSKNALIQKEVIDIINGKPQFSDPLFRLWFWKIFMGKK